MNSNKLSNEAENPALNKGDVNHSCTCHECGEVQTYSEMSYADNGNDYSYYCRKCGELLESNGNVYYNCG